MPMIARRALPSRLSLGVRCMPTRDHICKKSAHTLQGKWQWPPNRRRQSGTLGRAIPSQHTRTRTLGRMFLGYSRRDACPRPPEGTQFFTNASDSGVVSPAPPNRGMAGFDEKGAPYECICPHHGLQGMFARTRIALLASCMVASHCSKFAAQQYWQLGLRCKCNCSRHGQRHGVAWRAPCKE